MRDCQRTSSRSFEPETKNLDLQNSPWPCFAEQDGPKSALYGFTRRQLILSWVQVPPRRRTLDHGMAFAGPTCGAAAEAPGTREQTTRGG